MHAVQILTCWPARRTYADDHGRQNAVDLDKAGLVDFGYTRPLRRAPAYRGQRNFPGWWWSATTRSHVEYESWLERHYIIEADRDARVTGIAGQPFALTWPSGKRDVRHVPDLFCRGQQLNLLALSELVAAQRRLERIASRRGPSAAMRAFELASWYLEHAWRIDYHPYWYPVLLERWQERARAVGAAVADTTWQLPTWATHPECVALAAVFASPYWAALAVPRTNRRHRLFYQHLAAELGICDGSALRTMQVFAPLPGDIQEQARWGRILSVPEWNAPPLPGAVPRKILYHDITDTYEKSP